MSHLSLTTAPDDHFTVYVGVIIPQDLHFVLPQGRDSRSGLLPLGSSLTCLPLGSSLNLLVRAFKAKSGQTEQRKLLDQTFEHFVTK